MSETPASESQYGFAARITVALALAILVVFATSAATGLTAIDGAGPAATPVAADVTLPAASDQPVAATPGAEPLQPAGTTLAASEPSPVIESVLPALVQTDERLTVTYSTPGDPVDVTLYAEGPGGEVVLEESVEAGSEQTHEYDRSRTQALAGGPYDLTIEVEHASGAVTSTTEAGAFTIGDLHDPDAADFGAVEYEGVAGDFVEFDVVLNDVDEAYVLVGGDRADATEPLTAPVDILHVDGSTTILMNTRLVGTDRPSEEVYTALDASVTSYAHELGPDAEPAGVFADLRFENEDYEPVADTLTEFREAAFIGGQIRPLQPARYGMVLGEGDSILLRDDGVIDPRYPLDRSNFVLTEPSLGNVSTYLVPEGNANELRHEPDPDDLEEIDGTDIGTIRDMAIETDTITVGDRLLFEVEATGIWGSFVDALDDPAPVSDDRTELITPAEFAEFVTRPDGINFTAEHRNPPANVAFHPFQPLEADVDDAAIFTEPRVGPSVVDMERFYVLIDTRAPGAVPEPFEGGEELTFGFGIEAGADERFRFDPVEAGHLPGPYNTTTPGQFPYASDNASADRRTATVSIEERIVAFHNTDTDGNPIVTNDAGQTISGSTSLPPGSDPVDIIIDKRHLPESVEIEDVAIDGDGDFSVQADFSMLEPGAAVELEFWAYEQLMAEREVTVFGDEDEITEFVIDDFATESAVDVEENLVEMSATVTNTGERVGSETVELLVDGEVAETKTVTLTPWESGIVHFEDAAEDLEPGSHPLEVRTNDDSAQSLIVVDEVQSALAVDDLVVEAPRDRDADGPRINATVRNDGTTIGTDIVEFHISNESYVEPAPTLGLDEDGTIEPDAFVPAAIPGEFNASVETPDDELPASVIDEVFTRESVALLPGQEERFVVDSGFPDLDYGQYDIAVRTDDDAASGDLVIREADVVVSDFVASTPIAEDERLNATIGVTNVGNLESSANVTLSLEDEVIEEWTPALGPGNATTLSVDAVSLDREPGAYNLTVATPHDEWTRTLVVEEVEEPEEPEPPDEDEPEEDVDEDDDGLFGLVGRRETVVGTALVGAVHVLGYWI